MPRARLAVTCLLAITALSACNDDGRSLDPAPTVPVSAETTTTTTMAVTSGPAFDVDVGLAISSPTFAPGGLLPADFTCDGLDVPPPLTITGMPSNAAEVALTLTDRDAGGYVHWVLAGLDPSISQLESGVTPPGAVTAVSDGGVDGWEGPCPPEGDEPHEYVFTVYATAEPVGLAAGVPGGDAISLIQPAVIASNSLVARYAAPATR